MATLLSHCTDPTNVLTALACDDDHDGTMFSVNLGRSPVSSRIRIQGWRLSQELLVALVYDLQLAENARRLCFAVVLGPLSQQLAVTHRDDDVRFLGNRVIVGRDHDGALVVCETTE